VATFTFSNWAQRAGARNGLLTEQVITFAEDLLQQRELAALFGHAGGGKPPQDALQKAFDQRYPSIHALGELPAWVEQVERLRASARLQSLFLDCVLRFQCTQLPTGLNSGRLPDTANTAGPVWVLLAAYIFSLMPAEPPTGPLGMRLSPRSHLTDEHETIIRFLLAQSRLGEPATLADGIVITQISRGLYAMLDQVVLLPKMSRGEPELLAPFRRHCPQFAALSPLAWPQWISRQEGAIPPLPADALLALAQNERWTAAQSWLAGQLADVLTPGRGEAARALGPVFSRLAQEVVPEAEQGFPRLPAAGFLLRFYTLLLLTWRRQLDSNVAAVSGRADDFETLFQGLIRLQKHAELAHREFDTPELKALARQYHVFESEQLEQVFNRIRISYMQASVNGVPQA
jgi:hypothetical protein